MKVFAQLFYSSYIWPSDHVRNGNISSYCGANDSLVFGLNSIFNTRNPSVNSRSLLTNIFNLTSCERMQMIIPQSTVLTDVISTYSGPTTPPDQPCDAKCLEEIENDAIQVVRMIDYVNNIKLLFVVMLGERIRNFEQNINIPGI